MTYALHFTEQDWQRIENDWTGWWAGEGQPPPSAWLPLLKGIMDAGKLCQLYVSAEEARTIVRELGGGGFAFYITDAMAADEADQFIGVLMKDTGR